MSEQVRRVGVLTGGGDCPGLNAAIRAVARATVARGWEPVGYKHGWAGVLTAETVDVTGDAIRGIVHAGGTVLGTSRVDPYRDSSPSEILARLSADGVDALVVIGGEGTLSATARLSADGLKVVGVPKTIDNDVAHTDATIGFATAVGVATDAVDRLHTTAESHQRVMVLEVMGRHAGWIAAHAGLAGGADAVLLPERPFDLTAVAETIIRRAVGGRDFSIVVVAEGATPAPDSGFELAAVPSDEFGRPRLGGVGAAVASELEALVGFETRVTQLGHVQRGGSPSATDRVLAAKMGVAAVAAVADGAWGTMTALQGSAIGLVDLAAVAADSPATVTDEVIDALQVCC